MDLAVAVVGAVILVGGLSTAFVGYDYYLTQKENEETIQQQAEEMGLAEIPGVHSNPEYGLAIMTTGAAVAAVGGGLLVFGGTRRREPPQTDNGPPADPTARFCERCGEKLAAQIDSCPRCSQEKRSES